MGGVIGLVTVVNVIELVTAEVVAIVVVANASTLSMKEVVVLWCGLVFCICISLTIDVSVGLESNCLCTKFYLLLMSQKQPELTALILEFYDTVPHPYQFPYVICS